MKIDGSQEGKDIMFKNEDKYLKSLKKKDRYHFSIPFEYIKKNLGNDNYDIAVTKMEVDVKWSDSELGYIISYHVPKMHLIKRSEGNGTEADFYNYDVEPIVLDKLRALGITAEALVGGTGTW